MLKAYWQTRTQREKHFLMAGAAILALCCIYFGIWSPLNAHLATLQNKVDNNGHLLTWMQRTAPLIMAGREQSVKNDNRELFSIVDAHFRKTPLFGALYITRLNEKRLSISFKEITFNDLIKELIVLKAQYHIHVDELQVNRQQTEGLVEGKVILTK